MFKVSLFRRGLDWTSGWISLLKEWSNTFTGRRLMLQNVIRGKAGSEHWQSCSPACWLKHSQPTGWSTLVRIVSRRLLNIPSEGNSTPSLGSLIHCSTTCTVEKFFFMFQSNFLCFTNKLSAPNQVCFTHEGNWEVSLSQPTSFLFLSDFLLPPHWGRGQRQCLGGRLATRWNQATTAVQQSTSYL